MNDLKCGSCSLVCPKCKLLQFYKEGNVNKVRACVELFPEILTSTGYWLKLILSHAASNEANEICDILLSSGQIDLSILNEVLCHFCDSGNVFAARKAIEAGANINYVDEDGRTPAMNAALAGKVNIIDLLEEYDETNWNYKNNHGENILLVLFPIGDNFDIIQRLSLIEDLNWEIQDNNGMSILVKTMENSLCEYCSENTTALLSVPQIKYDVDYLKQKNVYEATVRECKNYVTNLMRDEGLEGDLVRFAKRKCLINMAAFIEHANDEWVRPRKIISLFP